MVKEIPLTQGKFAIVDDEDYEFLIKRKWQFSGGYATRRKYKEMRNKKCFYTTIPMHRLILKTPEGMCTDHINGDTLDNRKCNLRICTKQENQRNQRGSKNSKSKYKGVCWDKERKKWKAKIMVDYRTINLGRFICEHDAAKAYNNAAIEYFGEFAWLNEVIP